MLWYNVCYIITFFCHFADERTGKIMTASTSAHYNRIINLLATEVKKELIYFDFQSMGS